MKKQIGKYLVGALLAMFILPMQSWATGYAQTKYPILLVHGLFGFDSIAGIEYFYDIPESLHSDGATVYVDTVSAANSTLVRGEQLLTQVEQIIAATGAKKVNLIGHSHGGPTARYVAAVRPDLVASVTSVGGVNKGSAVADILINVAPPGSLSQSILATVANALASFIDLLTGSPNLPQNAIAAEQSLSTAGSLAFNVTYPQGVPTSACGNGAAEVNGVYYFSWSGHSQLTNILDASDPILALTSLAFTGDNDGLVSICSSGLGTVIATNYTQNHLDEVNQILGLTYIFAQYSPVQLYENQANRLKGLGL
ncbi:MAG: lipase family alpha/beta hydrolase [Burkholderiales bacterium]